MATERERLDALVKAARYELTSPQSPPPPKPDAVAEQMEAERKRTLARFPSRERR
jgi:hypothetical protein